jgi:hypothetical protein
MKVVGLTKGKKLCWRRRVVQSAPNTGLAAKPKRGALGQSLPVRVLRDCPGSAQSGLISRLTSAHPLGPNQI